MREILFKAKCIDGSKWISGLYVKDINRDKHYIFTGTLHVTGIFNKFEEWECFEIDCDTLCQYTGLTDKFGTKIWENGYISDGEVIWQVRYSKSMSGFYAQSVAGNKDGYGDCFSLWHLCHRHNKGRQVVYSDDRNELSRKMIERRQKHE